jgi:hypothetical protein
LGFIRSNHSADEILQAAAIDVNLRLSSLRKRWESSPIFAGHAELLNVAADRFVEKDWISANSILYPRIEGVLRNIAKATKAASFRQSALAEAPANAGDLPKMSRLLPHKFQRYLQDIYFQGFSPSEPAKMSRNSVGHGVAPPSEFSEKAAVIGLLIIEQIFYHMPPSTKQEAGKFGDEASKNI